MTVAERVAIAIGGLLLLGGALAIFLPTSPQGASCGTWVAPEWTEENTREIVEKTEDIRGQSLSSELADRGNAIAASAITSYRLCDDALGTRRTISIVLLALGVIAPVAVLFVGRGRSRTEAA